MTSMETKWGLTWTQTGKAVTTAKHRRARHRSRSKKEFHAVGKKKKKSGDVEKEGRGGDAH